MPRNPEWVQPKQYDRFKWKMKIPDEVLEREVGRKKKGPKEPRKSRPVEQKEKEKARDKEREKEQDPGKGKKQRQPADDQPTGGKEPPGAELERRGQGKEVDKRRTPRGPGKEVDLRDPDLGPQKPIWGGRWEVVRPPGIGGPLQTRQHSGPEKPAIGAGRRALPAGHSLPENTPAGAMERRRQGLADLVRESQASAQQGRAALNAGRERNEKGLTIYTGEIVGNTEYPLGPPASGQHALGGSQFKALGAGVADSTATGPIDRVKPTDVTTPLRPVRSGDTLHDLPVQSKAGDTLHDLPAQGLARSDTLHGKIISPQRPQTGPDTVNTREIPVIKGEVSRDFAVRSPLALEGRRTVGAAPQARAIGGPARQLTLFGGPAEEHHEPLAEAQAGREERRAITPPSMPPGRQVHFMRTNLPKKPGSQGTLFQTVQFKPK